MDAGVFTTDEANQCFKCVCGKLFKKLYNLKNHYKMHSTDKPYICSVCQRGFMRKHDLKRHATTHLQNFRPFECEDCHTLCMYTHILTILSR
ncbi:hypothetical protein DFJ77DRAFT_435193 [Powellomyces hirtus]|nr:hypothetical protein DFJ77DRAFT_435193 [Powellomyces hirtus]